MSRFPQPLVLICVLLMAVLSSPAHADGELSLLGGFHVGDYGTGVDSDNQAFTLRYVTGDTFQFRVEVPTLRVQSSYGILQTGFGATPVDEQHRGGPTGSGGQGTGGQGTGNPSQKTTAEMTTVEQWNTGVGDIRLTASQRLAGGGVRLFRFDAAIEVKLPTGDETLNLGTGEWDARLGLHGSYRFWSATGFAGAAFNKLGDPEWIELQDVVDLYVGVDSDPLAGGRLVLSGWLEGRDEVVEGVGSHAAVGLSLQSTGRLRWRGAIIKGLATASQDYSLVFGVSYGLFPKAWKRGLYR